MQIKHWPFLVVAFVIFCWNIQAAIYKEAGGIVVVEAEHFDSRKADATDDHHWHVVPDDDGKDALADAGDPPFVNARGGKYIQSLLFGIEKGAALNPARVATAPARRVGFFLANNTFINMTDDGKKVFDAAVKWAANLSTNAPPPVQAKFNAPTLQGSNITISWSGTGKLQQADAVTGPWTDGPNQNTPQTVPATGTAKFFRIRQ